ncbi:MAG: ABC transporter permease [Gemmatimonadetes bacterium]|nr:ABC transporter permease [Gemmatimonadota bacterium]
MTYIAAFEWRSAAARRRTFALNVVVPMLLIAPIAVSAAPGAHAAAAYTALFVLFGTFGAAIPMVRDAETGLLGRILLTGVSPRRYLGERALAHAALDTLQLAPALLVILLADGGPRRAAGALALPLALAAAMLAANALGILIAAFARSIAEAALFATVAGLLALHSSGVFRTPAAGSLAGRIEGMLPFSHLHELLLALTGAPASTSGLAQAGTAWGAALAAFALVLGLAPALLARPLPS